MARLHEAAAKGDIERVKELIALGDDVNDMSETLSAKGTTNIKLGYYSSKMTPLHLAAYNGHKQVIQLLIAAGAEINNKEGWRDESIYDSALEIAIRKNNLGLAKILKAAALRLLRDDL